MAAETRVLALVSDAIHPYNKGGKETRHDALAQRLHRHGVEVHIYTMHWWKGSAAGIGAGPNGAGPNGAGPNVRLHAVAPLMPLYVGERRSIRQAFVFSICSLRLLTKRFDVLEADAIPFLQLFPLKLVTMLRGKPMIVTWHEVWGPDYWRQYLGRLGTVAAWCERLAVSLPDHIIAASEGTADRLREISGGRARITVIPNGIDRDEIAAAPTAEATDLVCVGRLLAHKNVDVVIDALDILTGRGHDLTLTIVGEGPERQRLEAQVAARGLTARVRFTGALPGRGEVLAAMRAARVFAFPTVREGFGMAALEALGCGTPVITSDHPDNFARGLVTDHVNGLVVPAAPASFADAIEAVLADADRFAAGAHAAAAEYDWDALALQAAKVYWS